MPHFEKLLFKFSLIDNNCYFFGGYAFGSRDISVFFGIAIR